MSAKAPPPLPSSIRVYSNTARTVVLDWTSDSPHTSNSNLSQATDKVAIDSYSIEYQLSKSEENSGVYTSIYEGGAKTCTATSLIPLTKYTFKLRVKWVDDPDVNNWSKTSIQVETRTTDESEVSNAYTELYRAVKDSKVMIVQQILTRFGSQLDLNTRDKSGYTLLMLACQHSSYEVIHLLLQAGASPKESTRSGKTPLSIAVTYGNLKAVQCLVANGVDVNGADQGGSTALMWGVEHATSNKLSLDIIELLVRSNAQLDLEDSQGRTAFDRLCSSSGNAKAADILLSHGARQILTVSETHPRTSLMIAAMNGHRDLCRLLLTKHGAKLDEKNAFGYDAFDVAKSSGHQNVVDYFENYRKISKY